MIETNTLNLLIAAVVGIFSAGAWAMQRIIRVQADAFAKRSEADVKQYTNQIEIDAKRKELDLKNEELRIAERTAQLKWNESLQARVQNLEVDGEQWKNSYLVEVRRNDELEKRVTAAETKLAANEAELVVAKKQLQDTERQLRILTKERDTLQRRLDDALKELSELKERMDTSDLKKVSEPET